MYWDSIFIKYLKKKFISLERNVELYTFIHDNTKCLDLKGQIDILLVHYVLQVINYSAHEAKFLGLHW